MRRLSNTRERTCEIQDEAIRTMAQLIRILMVGLISIWLFQKAAIVYENINQYRQNSRWQAIESELLEAGNEALLWAEETLRKRQGASQ